MKKVLVPNGNYTDIRLIKAFKDMGYYVITSGNNPNLLGHKYADEYVEHDYSDCKGMLKLAREYQIDKISACSNDFGVTTAAYIAENMGLSGHDTFLNARIIAEKDLFKKFAQENHLQVIPSAEFDNRTIAKEYVKNVEYPIIVKPNDLGGGKGVSRADSVGEADKAIDYAFDMSKSKHIVVEPYIEGTQHSFTSFIVNKKVVADTSFNEYPCKNNPFLVGYTTVPALDIDNVRPQMVEQVEKIANLLDLVDGIFHVQYRMHNGKPLIMECMRRCLGNYALKAASEAIDFDWEHWIAKSYLGEDCSNAKQGLKDDRLLLHYYIQAPRNGRIKNVTIDDSITQYVYDEISQWASGLEVTNYSVEMIGFIFMKFPDIETRDTVAKSIESLIRVEMV